MGPGLVEIHLHIARGVHHHRLAAVADQVGGVREAADVELAEVHDGLLGWGLGRGFEGPLNESLTRGAPQRRSHRGTDTPE